MHPTTAMPRVNAELATLPAPDAPPSARHPPAPPQFHPLRSPPRPREMGLKKQVAEAKQSGVEASVRGFEAKLAAETRLAFRRAAIATERVRTAEQAVALRKRVFEVVQPKREAVRQRADALGRGRVPRRVERSSCCGGRSGPN